MIDHRVPISPALRPFAHFVALAGAALIAAGAHAVPPACAPSMLPTLSVPSHTTLTNAILKTTGGVEYCEVTGVIGPAPSNLRFLVGLPTRNRNGRFLMGGDGGFDGSVALPLNRVVQGYAAANSDSGHVTPPANDASWAFNNRTAEIDYGYRAAEQTTSGRETNHPVLLRESHRVLVLRRVLDGGRQALMAAQRDPVAFDGIVGGAPAHNLTRLAVEQNWSLRQFLPDKGPDSSVTDAIVLIALARIRARRLDRVC